MARTASAVLVAALFEVSSTQPEVEADPVLSAAERLDALAAKAPFNEAERDLFESMRQGTAD